MSASKLDFEYIIIKVVLYWKFMFAFCSICSRCEDGQYTTCLADSANALRSETEHSANVMSILAIILAIAILVLALFGAGLYFLK